MGAAVAATLPKHATRDHEKNDPDSLEIGKVGDSPFLLESCRYEHLAIGKKTYWSPKREASLNELAASELSIGGFYNSSTLLSGHLYHLAGDLASPKASSASKDIASIKRAYSRRST